MEESSHPYRHTKIIATLGPATESEEQLCKLILAGVDVFRLNMAHATREWVAEVMSRIRRVSAQVGRHVAVMMDVKGPEIRTGTLAKPIKLCAGGRILFCTELHQTMSTPPDPMAKDVDGGDIPEVSVNYPDLPRDVQIGATVLVDSGLMRFKILEKNETQILCEVLTPGTLESRRHINLPGVKVTLPAITHKDELDLRAGIDAGIDFVALSFVRERADVRKLREFLVRAGSPARIVSKIEEQAGVRNMHEIIEESDAIMIARGDLGIEVNYQDLPLIQTKMVRACHAEGKPVIIATHLLESMIHSPMPTRAEISDVSNAVRELADAVMLSGETTTGAYPLESVMVLKNIIESMEPTVGGSLNSCIELREPKAKMLRSSAVLAQELGDSGIIVFTRSGFLPYVLAALRPKSVPIFAFTDVEPTFRQMLLPWGVEPFLIEFSEDPEQTIQNALAYLKKQEWCDPGSWLVVITNALASEKVIDTLQLRQVE
ncbi:MAG: pyruvate kinase [Rubripirellula sp.]